MVRLGGERGDNEQLERENEQVKWRGDEQGRTGGVDKEMVYRYERKEVLAHVDLANSSRKAWSITSTACCDLDGRGSVYNFRLKLGTTGHDIHRVRVTTTKGALRGTAPDHSNAVLDSRGAFSNTSRNCQKLAQYDPRFSVRHASKLSQVDLSD